MSMCVDPSYQHSILFYKSEPGGSLSCTCDNAFVSRCSCEVLDTLRSTKRRWSELPTKQGRQWGNAHLVAMPLHLASMLSATRSPRRICRTLPLTVATCLMGSKVYPSSICHSTLQSIINWVSSPVPIGLSRFNTHSHPSCAKTSSKNGFPARTAVWWPLPRRKASR